MHSFTKMILAAGMAFAAADVADAASYSIAGLAVPVMTYTTLAKAQVLSRTSAYSGVGSLFVTVKSTATTGFGYLCSGSLINSTTVLTAAHCIYDHDEQGNYDPVTGINFYLPSFGERHNPGVEVYTASDFAFNAAYGGDIGSGHDVGIFTLSSAATGHETYDLYNGDPLRQYTEVGTGTIGGPAGTNVGITSDYEKRVGSNIFEHYGDELFSDVTNGVVLSDFDDGNPAHDFFGNYGDLLEYFYGDRYGFNYQGGVPGGDADSSPGDSGGPEFIGGKIASVTSFGITGGILQGYCGADSIDPYDQSGSTAEQDDLSLCTNSSVGELAGDTLVAPNLGFINAYLNAHGSPSEIASAPEPASWAMMLAGFGLVGGTMRRRQIRVSFAA